MPANSPQNLNSLMNRLKILVGAGSLAVLITGAFFTYYHHVVKSTRAPAHAANTATRQTAALQYARLPLGFEPSAQPTRFTARGAGYAIALEPSQATFLLKSKTALQPRSLSPSKRPQPILPQEQQAEPVLQMQFTGANLTAEAEALNPLPGATNYFHGNDPSQWRRNVAQFAKVKYSQVYPGIDLVYYGQQQQLEYDFVVQPGADPKVIKLHFAGADQVTINSAGELVLQAEGRELRQHKPTIYQEANGTRQTIEGGYRLAADGDVEFQLADYDSTKTLVIDPVFVYSTYLGGSGDEFGASITVDETGNAYIHGTTSSDDFPVKRAFQKTFAGEYDLFLTKLDPNGKLVFSTFIGGSGLDLWGSIALDKAGNIYFVGNTNSPNYPVKNAVQATYGGGDMYGDLYVTKLSASGSELIYSTYLGGSHDEFGNGIAVDDEGRAHIDGTSFSDDFPVRNAAQPKLANAPQESADLVVATLSANGKRLIFSTYWGGSQLEIGYYMAVDHAGNSYVAGSTNSPDFPTRHALQPNYGGDGPQGSGDGCITKFSPEGRVVYSTYFGGNGDDITIGIAVDGGGYAYVVGGTSSTDLPVKHAIQPTYKGFITMIDPNNPVYYGDGFVAKIDPSGQGLAYSTYLGGTDYDAAYNISLDEAGRPTIVGQTYSTDFPLKNPIQSVNHGGLVFGDIFITQLSALGDRILFSTYLGGTESDYPASVKVDRKNHIYVTGFTYSPNFPVTNNALQPAPGGVDAATNLGDAYVTKIDLQPDCVSACFSAARYWANHADDRLLGTVWIDAFTAVPSNAPVVTAALQERGTPLQNLRREFLATQLSLLASDQRMKVVGRPLSCQGLLFTPFYLKNGILLTSDVTFEDLVREVRGILQRRNRDEMDDVATLLHQLNAESNQQCR